MVDKVYINKKTMDGKEYGTVKTEDNGFMDRIEFINKTGVFVTPIHFDFIVHEYKESGLSKDEFIKQYLDEDNPEIITVPLNGMFKCIIDDDTITALGDDISCEDRTAYDIINDLSEQIDEERLKLETKNEMLSNLLKMNIYCRNALQLLLEKYQFDLLDNPELFGKVQLQVKSFIDIANLMSEETGIKADNEPEIINLQDYLKSEWLTGGQANE